MTDVVVLGAGAAGMMCAATAAMHGARVVILEHNQSPGKKIRISGGGRCNFTNRVVQSSNFLGSNPDFTRSALARFTPSDFIAMLERYDIGWHEKTLGQLFCNRSAQQVIDMLLTECSNVNVELRCGVRVVDVTSNDSHFAVATNNEEIHAKCVVVATGGLSIPTLGTSDIGYRIARHFSIPIVQTRPGLVPLLTDSEFTSKYSSLAGVSLRCNVSAHNSAFTESLLFTHRGLSGPSVLQISSYLDTNDVITVNPFPEGIPNNVLNVVQSDKRHVGTIVSTELPSRFVAAWSDTRMLQPRNSMSSATYREVLCAMEQWPIHIVGTEGYAKAEVTCGGVSTHALSSKTMEAQAVPGLYFIGECVDVTGWLGGYNFQWAWSSGYAAGVAVRERISSSM